MARYLIGDLQGCLDPLEALLDRLPLEPDDTLWFAGDLVNRGPDSLGVLRCLMALAREGRVRCVLGNHDLHLLGVAEGLARLHRSDTLDALLAAPDRRELLDWLRHQPLAIVEDGFLLVHAGVVPQWTAAQTRACAAEVEAALQGPDWHTFLAAMYGNQPDRWDPALAGLPRLRMITNALTRMRLCNAEGRMDFAFKGELSHAPDGLMAWFDVPGRATADTQVLFGHWSALGLYLRPGLVGVDTGCVWGRALTAVRLEDRAVFQVPGQAGGASGSD